MPAGPSVRASVGSASPKAIPIGPADAPPTERATARVANAVAILVTALMPELSLYAVSHIAMINPFFQIGFLGARRGSQARCSA